MYTAEYENKDSISYSRNLNYDLCVQIFSNSAFIHFWSILTFSWPLSAFVRLSRIFWMSFSNSWPTVPKHYWPLQFFKIFLFSKLCALFLDLLKIYKPRENFFFYNLTYIWLVAIIFLSLHSSKLFDVFSSLLGHLSFCDPSQNFQTNSSEPISQFYRKIATEKLMGIAMSPIFSFPNNHFCFFCCLYWPFTLWRFLKVFDHFFLSEFT